MSWILSLFIALALCSMRCFAATINVVDSKGNGIIYSTGSWTDTCTTCTLSPDVNRARQGSWHDANYDPATGVKPSLSFTFTGTDIAIFGILANGFPELATSTSLSFTLDGEAAGKFTHVSAKEEADSFVYDQRFFVANGLANGEHTFEMFLGEGETRSFVLFDYLTYSSTDGSSGGSSLSISAEAPPPSPSAPASSVTAPVASSTPAPSPRPISPSSEPISSSVSRTVAPTSLTTSRLPVASASGILPSTPVAQESAPASGALRNTLSTGLLLVFAITMVVL